MKKNNLRAGILLIVLVYSLLAVSSASAATLKVVAKADKQVYTTWQPILFTVQVYNGKNKVAPAKVTSAVATITYLKNSQKVTSFSLKQDLKGNNHNYRYPVPAYLYSGDYLVKVAVRDNKGNKGTTTLKFKLSSKLLTTDQLKTNIALASKYFVADNYPKAAEHYQKVYDSEKQFPTMYKDLTKNKWQISTGRELWLIIMDNLTLAYGITGQTQKALDIVTYGLKIDAQYPMFYYNLACINAARNDLEHVISNLKLAFKYKNKMVTGDKLPNPQTDSSFAKYLQDERFRAELGEMMADGSLGE